MILKALLENMDLLKIIEVWKIHQIENFSYKDNLVVLFINGIHICIYIEMITKEIICYYFWWVMLYLNMARFYISIIPIR